MPPLPYTPIPQYTTPFHTPIPLYPYTPVAAATFLFLHEGVVLVEEEELNIPTVCVQFVDLP